MTRQTVFQVATFIGALIGAIGTFSSNQAVTFIGVAVSGLSALGAYHFGKVETDRKQQESDAAQASLRSQLDAFHTEFKDKTDLIFQALDITTGVWTTIEMHNVPPGVADYLLLIFKSETGRISGQVRIKGSKILSSFSTTANGRIPVAIPNLWSHKDQQYVIPTFLEFTISEQTEPHASLSIYTQGWIDRRGQEPH